MRRLRRREPPSCPLPLWRAARSPVSTPRAAPVASAQSPPGSDASGELAIGAALRKPARRLQTTPATLAIAFTLVHPRSASTLIGATSPAQIDDALAAVELAGRLGPEDVSALRALADRAL